MQCFDLIWAVVLISPSVMAVRPGWVVMHKAKVFHGIDLPNAFNFYLAQIAYRHIGISLVVIPNSNTIALVGRRLNGWFFR